MPSLVSKTTFSDMHTMMGVRLALLTLQLPRWAKAASMYRGLRTIAAGTLGEPITTTLSAKKRSLRIGGAARSR